jgi:hypothetical protein
MTFDNQFFTSFQMSIRRSGFPKILGLPGVKRCVLECFLWEECDSNWILPADLSQVWSLNKRCCNSICHILFEIWRPGVISQLFYGQFVICEIFMCVFGVFKCLNFYFWYWKLWTIDFLQAVPKRLAVKICIVQNLVEWSVRLLLSAKMRKQKIVACKKALNVL